MNELKSSYRAGRLPDPGLDRSSGIIVALSAQVTDYNYYAHILLLVSMVLLWHL